MTDNNENSQEKNIAEAIYYYYYETPNFSVDTSKAPDQAKSLDPNIKDRVLYFLRTEFINPLFPEKINEPYTNLILAESILLQTAKGITCNQNFQLGT